jgi:hypothetical protein
MASMIVMSRLVVYGEENGMIVLILGVRLNMQISGGLGLTVKYICYARYDRNKRETKSVPGLSDQAHRHQ